MAQFLSFTNNKRTAHLELKPPCKGVHDPEQVHGVYAPGNVQLDPEILGNSQIYIADKIGAAEGSKPVSFVFHGGG